MFDASSDRHPIDLLAEELPALAAKHERLCEAAQEPTHSGALRRAVHASKILLDDLAHRLLGGHIQLVVGRR